MHQTRLTKHLDKYGQIGLVAGGANGLGLAFSRALANCGKDVIMVDNDANALDKACKQLTDEHGGNIIPIHLDLTQADAAQVVTAAIEKHRCRLIIYNAAYGPVKPFASNDDSELDRYIDLNCRTLLKLTWHFVQVQHNGPAGFLAMSSMAGWRGTQFVAPYAASKAFTWNLMESLHYEFRSAGMDFTAILGGPIATENFLATDPKQVRLAPKPAKPDDVAVKALMRLGKSAVSTLGLSGKLSEFVLTRLLPRKAATSLNNRVMAKMYKHHWTKK